MDLVGDLRPQGARLSGCAPEVKFRFAGYRARDLHRCVVDPGDLVQRRVRVLVRRTSATGAPKGCSTFTRTAPAHCLVNRRQATKADLRQKIGGAAFGGLLSGIAMAPGYLLNRLGLLMLSIHGLKVFGIIVLSVGSALYAASVTSVKAVKLSTKLMSDTPNVTGHQE